MNSIQILKSPHEAQTWRFGLKGSIGFVPTMGALHAGHEALLKAAYEENDFIVLSIFVNPTQFNDPVDFAKYPKTWDEDLRIAQKCGVDAVFYPQYKDMYPDDYAYRISESKNSQLLDGLHRPGHFDGVLTVVLKLLNIISPTRAYFGEKDYQQLTLIREMVSALFIPTQIVPVPTLRESDGLAMSSRNVRLTPQERAIAPLVYKAVSSAKSPEEARQLLADAGFKVDYVEEVWGRRFVAATIGNVRLIDNVQI